MGSQGSKYTVVVPSLFRGLLLLATPTGTNGLVTAAFQLDGDFGMATGLPAPWHLAKQPPGDVPQHPAPAGTRVVRPGPQFKLRLSMSQGGHSIHEDFRMLRRQVQHSLKPVSQRIRTVPSVQRETRSLCARSPGRRIERHTGKNTVGSVLKTSGALTINTFPHSDTWWNSHSGIRERMNPQRRQNGLMEPTSSTYRDL